jgi:hypothetical protein
MHDNGVTPLTFCGWMVTVNNLLANLNATEHDRHDLEAAWLWESDFI